MGLLTMNELAGLGWRWPWEPRRRAPRPRRVVVLPSGMVPIEEAARMHTGYSGQEPTESDYEFFTRMRRSQQRHLARESRRRRRQPGFEPAELIRIRYPGGGPGHPIQTRVLPASQPPEQIPMQLWVDPGAQVLPRELFARRRAAQRSYLAQFNAGRAAFGPAALPASVMMA